MVHHPIRASEYRQRAVDEAAAGQAASLDQVRARHVRAAKVWAELADAEEARQAARDVRFAAVRVRDEAEPPP